MVVVAATQPEALQRASATPEQAADGENLCLRLRQIIVRFQVEETSVPAL